MEVLVSARSALTLTLALLPNALARSRTDLSLHLRPQNKPPLRVPQYPHNRRLVTIPNLLPCLHLHTTRRMACLGITRCQDIQCIHLRILTLILPPLLPLHHNSLSSKQLHNSTNSNTATPLTRRRRHHHQTPQTRHKRVKAHNSRITLTTPLLTGTTRAIPESHGPITLGILPLTQLNTQLIHPIAKEAVTLRMVTPGITTKLEY